MNMQKAIKKTKSYEDSLCLSLISYAKKNPSFYFTIKDKVSRFSLTGEEICCSSNCIEILEPVDEYAATKRLEWIVNESKFAENNIATLISFVSTNEREEPKQIIVGITATDIPGLTLGRFKTKVFMTFLINSDLVSDRGIETTEKITQTSLQIFQNAMERANGDIRKIDPDTAEWFFGDKKISFYETKGEEIEKIKREIKELNIPYSEIKEKEETAFLAINPSFNGDNASLYWKLNPLQ